MKHLKKGGIFLLKSILGFVVFIIVYVLAAVGLSRITVNANQEIKKQEVTIYILSNGVHTDIVVPVRNNIYDWSQQIKFSDAKAKDSSATYLAMGWGDKGFYLNTPTWGDLKFSTAFKAATGLSTSAMHCTFYHSLKVNPKCKKISISEEDYKSLIGYIKGSFVMSGNTISKIDTKAVYGKNDVFYEANGSYNLFFTCNTWANNALKAAHQKAAFWTPYEEGIFMHYE